VIVILSCGQRKQAERSRAKDLYTGPYFRAALAYATSRVALERIFILSAKYGLLALEDRVDPYELKLGQPGSVTVEKARQQARQLGLLPVTDVMMVIAGKKYQDFLMGVFETGFLMPCTGGIGQQIQWLRAHTKETK